MIDIPAVQQWLTDLPGGSQVEEHLLTWNEFNDRDRPVVTLFGSYDTGKSSLLRRILVDAGEQVPDWLTISARHETFEANEARLGDCAVRDTPGFAVGATDARAENNTRRALSAVGLTDIGVAVLTPQLVTADRDLFQIILDRGWPVDALWFVISRFDETGVNPEYDLDEYQALADRKVTELRELFALDSETPIFVVAQDPFQQAGSDTGVMPDEWDEFRSWDGMALLQEHLTTINSSPLPEWRAQAGQRYWSHVLAETITDLREGLPALQANAKIAAHGVARRDSWESELAALDRAARTGLDGLVDEVIRDWWTGADPQTAQLQADIERAVTNWFTEHENRLVRLRRSIQKAADRDRHQPNWEGFTSLVDALNAAPNAATTAGGATPSPIAPQVRKAGSLLITVMKALPQTRVAATAKPAATAKVPASGVGAYIPAATAALELAVFVAGLVDDQRAQAAAQTNGVTAMMATHQDHARLAAACTAHAQAEWEALVIDTQALIDNETGDQIELDSGLRATVSEVEAAIRDGERLLKASAFRSDPLP